MKNNKNLYLNLLIFVGGIAAIIAGALIVTLTHANRIVALGGLMICIGGFALCMGIIRVAALHVVNKEKTKKARQDKRELTQLYKAFPSDAERPETNTIRVVNCGFEFAAEGRFVCKEDFKNVRGHHFAFEINSTKFIGKPDGYDDDCYLEENGVLVMAGYHDGEALEEYANDNGIVLQDNVEKLVGQRIALKQDEGYNLYVWTAEGDEISCGFVDVLKYENDVLTVFFAVKAPCGLNDTVVGTVELKRDTSDENCDVHALIEKIKRKRYNTLAVPDSEAREILQKNPFLPQGYIEFIREVGFADMDWIDIGRNADTPTNLNDDEIGYLNDILADYPDVNLNDFYFFAIDSNDTYYAFLRKADDEKVYVFSNDASGISTYENFEIFLTEIMSV